MLFLADLAPLEHEKVVCSIAASIEYQVPADILLGIADIEAGRPFTVSRNNNGTIDIGVMQFNSSYLRDDLAKYGIKAEDVAGEGCYPYRLAAWRIKGHIENDTNGDIWTRASNYHSKTPKFNGIYREKLIVKAAKWAKWLKEHFSTAHLDK